MARATTAGGAEQAPDEKPKGFAMPPVRGSDAWRQWVTGLIDHDRSSWPDVVDRALVVFARSIGYKPNPPRR
jgi:hypothetical protein